MDCKLLSGQVNDPYTYQDTEQEVGKQRHHTTMTSNKM